MGHDLPVGVRPTLTDLIDTHIRTARSTDATHR
jgi:hypothetical protein